MLKVAIRFAMILNRYVRNYKVNKFFSFYTIREYIEINEFSYATFTRVCDDTGKLIKYIDVKLFVRFVN